MHVNPYSVVWVKCWLGVDRCWRWRWVDQCVGASYFFFSDGTVLRTMDNRRCLCVSAPLGYFVTVHLENGTWDTMR